MPGGRPPKITPAIKSKIADCFLVALTDEQTAAVCGINEKTIRRMRAAEFCPEIKKAEMEREMKYRLKLWTSKTLPAGICFMLERKYPNQFAKPEVQFQINNNTQVTNNSLIVSAEIGDQIVSRSKIAKAKVVELFNERRPINGNGHSPPEATE